MHFMGLLACNKCVVNVVKLSICRQKPRTSITADSTRGDTINMLLFCRWREPTVTFNVSSKWPFDGHTLFNKPSLKCSLKLSIRAAR